MNRRALIKALSSGTVVISIGGVSFVACQDDKFKPEFFQSDSFHFLSDLSETMLPDCEESPGAKIAGVASFLDRYIPVCKSPKFQSDIKATIEKLHKFSEGNNGGPLHRLSKVELKEQFGSFKKIDKEGFSELKSLILFAYFSSMEGMTKALSYIAVPGKYDGDILYENNQKAWAI